RESFARIAARSRETPYRNQCVFVARSFHAPVTSEKSMLARPCHLFSGSVLPLKAQAGIDRRHTVNILPAGSTAPVFTLHSTPDQTVSLSEFRGRNVILAFYPADWSPVCGDQLALYNEILPMFKQHNAELLGLSVDGVWCHLAYRKDRNLAFPLLSDFEPKGEVARLYGAYRDKEGVTERALF